MSHVEGRCWKTNHIWTIKRFFIQSLKQLTVTTILLCVMLCSQILELKHKFLMQSETISSWLGSRVSKHPFLTILWHLALQEAVCMYMWSMVCMWSLVTGWLPLGKLVIDYEDIRSLWTRKQVKGLCCLRPSAHLVQLSCLYLWQSLMKPYKYAMLSKFHKSAI